MMDNSFQQFLGGGSGNLTQGFIKGVDALEYGLFTKVFHDDTMCQINNRIPKCTSVDNFKVSRNFQPSRHYGLGCGPVTERETMTTQ